MLRRHKRGQTLVEYVVLIIIVLGALVAMSNYLKRGLQGRWKAAMDDLGDQYDPRVADTVLNHKMTQSINTSIIAMNTVNGYWTKRTDNSMSTESKTGTIAVFGY